jgi:N-acetylglucosaminyl-diphospho-decaprenol L-rhamnosyltransferase
VRVPVFVIHYESPRWCEESVSSLTTSEGVDVDITVVHNGGEIPQLPNTTKLIVPDHNLGFTGGANLGIRELLNTDAEYVLIASHDLIVEPNTLSGMVATAQRHERCGIVGPRYSEPKHDRCRIEFDDGDTIVDAWIGACLLLKRACVEDVGEFDERFGSYLEDIDYCYRARDLGWEVRVAPVVADTLGTQSDRVHAIATANWTLFHLKRAPSLRDRTRLRLRMLSGYVRALLSSKAPWRSRAQRDRSAVYRDEWRRVIDVTRHLSDHSRHRPKGAPGRP